MDEKYSEKIGRFWFVCGYSLEPPLIVHINGPPTVREARRSKGRFTCFHLTSVNYKSIISHKVQGEEKGHAGLLVIKSVSALGHDTPILLMQIECMDQPHDGSSLFMSYMSVCLDKPANLYNSHIY